MESELRQTQQLMQKRQTTEEDLGTKLVKLQVHNSSIRYMERIFWSFFLSNPLLLFDSNNRLFDQLFDQF